MKKQKGITLIALVITIILLIILAGITINIVFNKGIIEKSEQGVDTYAEEGAREKLLVTLIDYKLEKLSKKDEYIELETYLEDDKEIDVTDSDEDYVYVIVDEYEFTVDKETLEIVSLGLAKGEAPTIKIDKNYDEEENNVKVTVTATAVNGGQLTISIIGNNVIDNEDGTFTIIKNDTYMVIVEEEGNRRKARQELEIDEIQIIMYTVTIDDSDEGIESVVGKGEVENGTTITIKAEIKEGYEFINWEIDGDTSCIIENKYNEETTLIVNSNISLKAVVGEALVHAEDISVTAKKGSTVVSSVEKGGSVTLTATTTPGVIDDTIYWSTNVGTLSSNTGASTTLSVGSTVAVGTVITVTATCKNIYTNEATATESIALTVGNPPDSAKVNTSVTNHTAKSLDSKYSGITWGTLVKIANIISTQSAVKYTTEEVTVVCDGKTYVVGIGDTKTIKYGSKTYTTRILGFNHDTLKTSRTVEGKTITKAGISFKFTSTVILKALRAESTSNGGWIKETSTTYAYPWLQKTLKPAVESANTGLKIKQVNKLYASKTAYNKGTVKTSADYMWILALSEMFPLSNGTYGSEGVTEFKEGDRYRYYTKNSSATYRQKSGASTYWWTRSPLKNSSDEFIEMRANGSSFYCEAACTSAISPCFSI